MLPRASWRWRTPPCGCKKMSWVVSRENVCAAVALSTYTWSTSWMVRNRCTCTPSTPPAETRSRSPLLSASTLRNSTIFECMEYWFNVCMKNVDKGIFDLDGLPISVVVVGLAVGHPVVEQGTEVNPYAPRFQHLVYRLHISDIYVRSGISNYVIMYTCFYTCT